MISAEKIRKSLPDKCRLLAVSKLQPADKIRSLFQNGQKSFAENYVQEALEKQQQLADLEIEWHFIGHLQKNKAKDVVGRFALIHSVDSWELAEALNRRAEMSGIKQKILLQINLALEATKGGFSEAALEERWLLLANLEFLEICGLMTMPPPFENPEQARPYFRQLREWQQKLSRTHPMVTELSMGTSSDYQVAAEEGATWVRLGTLLFGERPTR